MKLKGTVLSLLIGAAFSSSPADALTRQCENCTVPQMDIVATENLYAMQYFGPLYIVNIEDGVARKYIFATDSTEETDPEFDPINVWAEPVPVEAEIATSIQQAGVLAQNMQDWVIRNPDRNDLPVDAHQALNQSNFDEEISNYLASMSSHHATNQIADLLLRIGPVPFFNPQELFVNIQFIYQDGSRATYAWNPVLEDYKRIPNTSRDSNGNLIPETSADIDAGGIINYVFDYEVPEHNQDDYDDMLGRLYNLGVPIQFVGSSTGSGYYTMTCAGGICTVFWVQQ